MARIVGIHLLWDTATELTLWAILVLLVLPSEAQNLSPYSAFQSLSPAELQTVQVKLTYVGSQKDITSTVAFTSPTNTLDLSIFVPFHRSGISYFNDTTRVNSFSATTTHLQAVINDVGSLPNVTAGGVAAAPYLSFALSKTAGGTKVFEAIVNKSDTADLFAQLRSALQGNAAGLKELSGMACPLGVLEPGIPTDVSEQVSVTRSGVRPNPTTGNWVGTATVKNTSSSTINGPISLVFDLKGNVTLFNNNGVTCRTVPRGREFINLSLTNNALSAGASSQVALQFANPDVEPVVGTTKVLAGTGAR